MLKLVLDEPESVPLKEFARDAQSGNAAPTTSWLGEAEFRRAGMRYAIAAAEVEATLAEFDALEHPREDFEQASRLPFGDLRTLDAIHIAAALRARAAYFVTYDRRQGEAAAALGLNVVSP